MSMEQRYRSALRGKEPSPRWRRQTLAAHKLIATPKGEMAYLSKENDSNGCIGTVDVSYPSIPVLLKYAPELVNALCRPVLEFASMPDPQNPRSSVIAAWSAAALLANLASPLQFF